MKVSQLLLQTLEDLDDEEFGRFKWDLIEGSDSWTGIPKSYIQKAPRTETVSKMTQRYMEEQAVSITAEILKEMGNKKGAEKLKKAYAELKGTAAPGAPGAAPGAPGAAPGASGAAPGAAPVAAPGAPPATISAVNGGVVFAPNVSGSTTGQWNITINRS